MYAVGQGGTRVHALTISLNNSKWRNFRDGIMLYL